MIFNETRGVRIAASADVCTRVWGKARGLMFSRRMQRPLVMVFTRSRKVSLHMWFVFFPIDVVFLDTGGTVVDMKEHFRPFSMYRSRQESRYCLELPVGTIRASDTHIGDKITVKGYL